MEKRNPGDSESMIAALPDHIGLEDEWIKTAVISHGC